MIIKNISENDKQLFFKLCKEFYSAGATARSYDEKIAETTFNYLMHQHENLWGYFIYGDEDTEPAGYALVTSYWCNEDGGNVIILDELYVNPMHRHHGYGKQFLEWLEDEFRGKAVSITLEVVTTNTVAKQLYAHEGFDADGFEVLTKRL